MKTLILPQHQDLTVLLASHNIHNYYLTDDKDCPITLNEVGYYRVHTDKDTIALIYYPTQGYCSNEKTFGFHTALFSLRSENDSGIGDFGVLRELIVEAKKIGASFIQLNPIYAIDHSWFHSPYEPISRFSVDPIYIDLDQVMAELELNPVDFINESERKRLNQLEAIDYSAVLRFKHDVLYKIFCKKRPHFSETYRLLSEKMAELHSEFLEMVDETDILPFLCWLHDTAARQFDEIKLLAKEELGQGIFVDLPMGLSPETIDTHRTNAINLHANPTINATEQQWAIASFDYNQFEHESYDYFIESLRYAMKNSGAIRIDNDSSLGKLTYFCQKGQCNKELSFDNRETLMAILLLESQRNQCQLIFECGFNYSEEELDELEMKGIVVQNMYLFTTRPTDHFICQPEEFRRNVFLMFSTHDVYPLKALLTSICSPIDLTEMPNEGWQWLVDVHNNYLDKALTTRFKLSQLSLDDKVLNAHLLGAQSNATMFSIALVDVLLMTERVNVPNTSYGYGNWRLRLNKSVSAVFDDPTLHTLFSDIKKLRKH